MNMLGLAKRTRARFLLTSTSEVGTGLLSSQSPHHLMRGVLSFLLHTVLTVTSLPHASGVQLHVDWHVHLS